MASVEQVLLRQLYNEVLSKVGDEEQVTTAMLVSWHRRWLGNVYAWAGAERTVNVSKDGFAFATAAYLPELLQGFQHEQLNMYTPCRPSSVVELLDALSSVHIELILIHPFREGNGRIARLLCDVMSVQAEIGQFPEKPIPLYGDGQNVRDWLYVEDHVDALLRGRPWRTYEQRGGGSDLQCAR